MASSDAQEDWAIGCTGAPLEEAARVALLLENSAEAPTMAEPPGTQTPELVLEGGIDVVGSEVYWKMLTLKIWLDR